MPHMKPIYWVILLCFFSFLLQWMWSMLYAFIKYLNEEFKKNKLKKKFKFKW